MKLHDITYDTPGDKSIWTWRALSQPITWEEFEIYRTTPNRPQLDSPFQALSLLTKLEATDAQWLKALEYFTDTLYRLNLPERASFARQALDARGLKIDLTPEQAQRILRNPSAEREGQFFTIAHQILQPSQQIYHFVREHLNDCVRNNTVSGANADSWAQDFLDASPDSIHWNIQDNRVALYTEAADYDALLGLVQRQELSVPEFLNIYAQRTVSRAKVGYHDDAQQTHSNKFCMTLTENLPKMPPEVIEEFKQLSTSFIDNWLRDTPTPTFEKQDRWNIWWDYLSTLNDANLLDFRSPSPGLKNVLNHLNEQMTYFEEHYQNKNFYTELSLRSENQQLANQHPNIAKLLWASVSGRYVDLDSPSKIKIQTGPWLQMVEPEHLLSKLTAIRDKYNDNQINQMKAKLYLYLPFFHKEQIAKILPDLTRMMVFEPLKGLSLASLKKLWKEQSTSTAFDVSVSVPRIYTTEEAFLFVVSNQKDPRTLIKTMESLDAKHNAEVYREMVTTWCKEQYNLTTSVELPNNMDFTL